MSTPSSFLLTRLEMALSFFVLLGILRLSLASVLSISRQVQLGDHEYFVPPTAAWKLDSWDSDKTSNHDGFVPVTVVDLNGTASASRVRSVLDKYDDVDDVWTSSFAQALYIQSEVETKNNEWIQDLAPKYNVSVVFYSNDGNFTAPGPYFVHKQTGDMYQAYRLYPDVNQAFIQSSYQDPSGTHHPLRAASHSAGGLTIAVPSRLHFSPTKDKPLAGVRIAVKYLYDLKGLKTSGGSRALFEISSVKNKTAAAVQKLINAGAVIIGKNKLSEFAFGGIYVTEHIDYLLPFNPRGDGYNSPSDSSGGSGASVASYEWLDASLGSDTGGSIRGPAAANGVHGNRPSQDAVDLTGALVLSTAMDTAGILARDPVIWSKVNKALYAGSIKDYRKYPKSIFIDPSSAEALATAEEQFPELAAAATKFINSLSKLLSANASTFSIDEEWNKSSPTAFIETPISSIVDNVYRNLTWYEQWNEFGKGFVEEYKDSHDGQFPHMVFGTRYGWMIANNTMARETHEQDLEYKKGVADWVTENFLLPDDETCSDAIYLYFTTPDSTFRYKPDVSRDANNPYIRELITSVSDQFITILQLNTTLNCNTTLGDPEACDMSLEALENATAPPAATRAYPGRFASVAGLPDYAITLGSFNLGETTFSNSTLQNQSLPLAVDIMAAKGCDFMILNLVEELYRKGIVRKVKTGPVA
ncbi:hypothetical protein QQX98_007752 [Neonectria punicea]|uniref:Amidase domain-containing protein n=1 Tax=Neonectria punicea TaxID=979145 RepID=A0ABR1GX44_9HYPO